MKRKIASLLLALTMLASMGSIAYADESSGDGSQTITDLGGSASAGVFGIYDAESEPDPVYSVNVAWESMTFKCEVQGTKTWNPVTHKYNNQQTFVWENLDGSPDTNTKHTRTITVTNNSSVSVQVAASASAQESNYGIGLGVHPDKTTLYTLATNPLAQNSAEINVTIKPPTRPVDGMPQSFTLGTVTITVQASSPGAP